MPRPKATSLPFPLPSRGIFSATVVFAFLALTSCESYVRSRAFEQHAPLREGSLAWWIPRSIENEDALAWLIARSAIVLDGADSAGLEPGATKKLALKTTRDGKPVSPSLGSAVAVTDDGYYITAAHCLSDKPFVLVAKDGSDTFFERRGRIIWTGFAKGGNIDVALIHVPDVSSRPLAWADLANAPGGTDVLSAGVGYGATRLAAGHITGGPTGTQEAPPGAALSFRVDSPLIPGDSGGPTILPDGALLGICATVEIEFFGAASGGEVLRPNPAFIERLIADDRERGISDTLAP